MTKKLSKQTCELTLMHTFDKNSGMKTRQLYLYRGSMSQRFDKLKEKTKSKIIKNNALGTYLVTLIFHAFSEAGCVMQC